jgi:hypothetical protein
MNFTALSLIHLEVVVLEWFGLEVELLLLMLLLFSRQRKYDQHGYRIESNSNEVGDDDNDNNIDDANMDNEYEYMDPGNLDIGYEAYNKEVELERSNLILIKFCILNNVYIGNINKTITINYYLLFQLLINILNNYYLYYKKLYTTTFN